VVMEFWPYGIRRAEAYPALREAVLKYTRLYDLSRIKPEAISPKSIDSLYTELGETGASTDILLS
jgi:hypothetical protein